MADTTGRAQTDLRQKCGSCSDALPTVAFGGSKCYVKCKNTDRFYESFYKRPSAQVRHRTTRACKRYKQKEFEE